MAEVEEQETILSLAEEKISLGKKLIEKLNSYKYIEGSQKIQRKINQEIKFLQKAKAANTLKLNNVTCSNLTHYEFLVKVLQMQRDVVHIDCGFPVEGKQNPLRVDIVCENGLRWIKVIARNSKSLSDAAKGYSSFGARSIIDQASEYVCIAHQNLCMFEKPKVTFYFIQDIENELLEALKSKGVEICTIDGDLSSHNTISTNSNNIDVLNLDVTTLLAYISSLTNGSFRWIFKEPILTEQAEKERKSPVKQILDKLFYEKQLICCETAVQSFQEIVSLLAGPNEKQRAKDLIKKLEIFPDIEEIPEKFAALNVGGKIKPRSLKIFAFGIDKKAVTVTSNEGFIRSAKMQGINVPVFIHQARALTEAKEKFAMPANF